MSIIENGPQRAVVRIVGWYYSGDAARPIARAELRGEFTRGQPWWKLSHTYTYAGDPWHDTLGSTGITFQFARGGFQSSAVEVDGRKIEGRTLSVRQINDMTALVGDQVGRHASGAVVLSGSEGGASVYHRGLWRMAPKQVDADAATGTVTFHYWPRSAGAMSWRPDEDTWVSSSSAPHALAVGVSRTHEFIIEENAANDRPEPVTAAQLHDEPVLAIVAPRYLCATNAIHGLQPYDPAGQPEIESTISEIIDSYNLHRQVYGLYGQWFYGSIGNMFDQERKLWAWHGRFGNVLNEQDIIHGPWLAYLRSGDRKYYDYALTNTTHLMDVGTIRLNPDFPEIVGLSRRHHDTAWLGDGDHGHSMLDPFLEMYHVTGETRAFEAADRMAGGMAQIRGGSWRYISNPLSGLSRMYLETGEAWYKEQADRIWRELCVPDRNAWYAGDHGGRAAVNYGQINEECLKVFIEMAQAKPASFDSVDALAELYRRTGDAKYLELMGKAVEQHLKLKQEYDARREDPMFWSVARHTQFIGSMLRELAYVVRKGQGVAP
jgi:hypothetical protein